MDYLRYYIGPVCVAIGALGFYLGADWVWLGFATYFLLASADIFLPRDTKKRNIVNPRLADVPLYCHFVLIIAMYVLFTLFAKEGNLTEFQIAGAILSLGWLSAVPNLPVQHEFMHRKGLIPRLCTFILGGLYGDPIKGIAHVHGHHLDFGTSADTDQARRGETMYTFPFRASWGSYSHAWRAEKRRLQNKSLPILSIENLCVRAIIFEIVLFSTIAFVAGAMATTIALIGIVIAKILVEAFNYYQHYGLVRSENESYDRRHLWNHLQPAARSVAFEITNHSDHHMDTFKPFYKLSPDTDGPQMPSIFLCFMAGLIPPLWFRYIAMPKLKQWDQQYATPEEKRLAMKANEQANWPKWLEDQASLESQRDPAGNQ